MGPWAKETSSPSAKTIWQRYGRWKVLLGLAWSRAAWWSVWKGLAALNICNSVMSSSEANKLTVPVELLRGATPWRESASHRASFAESCRSQSKLLLELSLWFSGMRKKAVK